MKRILYTFLLAILALSTGMAQNKSLVYVAPDVSEATDKDVQVINAINAHGGYDITTIEFGLIDEGYDLPTLNGADVVIMGRGISSDDVGAGKEVWDMVTTPVVTMNMWGMRNMANKGYWVATEGGTTENVVADEFAVIEGTLQGDDPVFGGKSGTITWWNGRFSAFLPDTDFGNATVLAISTDNRVLMARWAANVEYYSGAGRSPMGERTYIGNGQDNTAPNNYFGFSDAAAEIFFAELARMAEGATPAEDVKAETSKLTVFATTAMVSINMVDLNRVEVYSLDGKKMISSVAQNNTLELNTSLNNGIYVVKAFDSKGSISTEKFIVR